MTSEAPANPYKGLAAFDETDLDALLFFGRERDTEVIAANLLAARLTVLYGPPGVGKSSVLRAGVVRRVRALEPDALVLVHDFWAGGAVANLARAVASAGPGEEEPDRARIADRLAELVGRHGGSAYLVLDQFEEVFTYADAAALVGELAEVVTRPKLRVNVLVGLREDALSALDAFTGRVPDVFGNALPLDRIDRAAGRAAIAGPVARHNELAPDRAVELEPALVDAVLDEVAVGRVSLGGVARGAADAPTDGRIEAPYLQLVMQRLWDEERARGSRVLARATLAELGGAHEIVRAHFERAVAALAADERDVAARVFDHLVTPSGTKVAHRVGDLAGYADVSDEEVRPVLEALATERILRPLDGRFEIFHDVLADAVLAWRARHESERALARQRAEAERRHRRLARVVAASLAAVVAMAALTVYALAQRSDAREQTGAARAAAERATARSLDAEASALIPIARGDVDPELGLLLAAEAARLSPTPGAEDILRRALLVSSLRRVLPERGVTAASFAGERIVVGTARGEAAVHADGARVRLATRGRGAVTSVAGSADGRYALTTEDGGPARLWDAATGRELRAFGEAASAASFSPDATLVATVENGVARVWRAAEGTLVATVRQPDPVQQISFSSRGGLVATVGTGRVARVFEARTGRLVAAVDQGGTVTSATLTPDERRLVTTGYNPTARVWSLRRGGTLVHELRGHVGRVTAGAVSPDGGLVATASTDASTRVWRLRDGSLVTPLGGHTNRVTGVAFSADSSWLATSSTDRSARIWRPERGTIRAILYGHTDAVTGVSFSSSGNHVLTTAADGRARLWSPFEARLRPLAKLPLPVDAAAYGGSVVAVAGRGAIRVLDAAGGRIIATLPAAPTTVLAVSGDGSLVAAASADRVAVWRVATRDRVATIDAEPAATAVALSLDGRTVAIGNGRGDVELRNVDGQLLATLSALRGRIASVAFDPAGERVAAGLGNGGVALWTRGGRRLYQRPGHRRGTSVTSVAFTSTGGRFVTAGADGEARIWNTATGRTIQTLRGHIGSVAGAAFSRDGRWAVTAGPGTAGLWDLVNRQRLLFLEGHSGRVLAASFDRGGRRLTTVGDDGTIRAYDCDTCGGIPELLALAERRLGGTGRTLTRAERRRYLGGG